VMDSLLCGQLLPFTALAPSGSEQVKDSAAKVSDDRCAGMRAGFVEKLVETVTYPGGADLAGQFQCGRPGNLGNQFAGGFITPGAEDDRDVPGEAPLLDAAPGQLGQLGGG